MSVNKIYERTVDLNPHEMKIYTYPDPILHKKCEDVTRFDTEEEHYLSQLFIDMALTAINNLGIGIAAPQVGILANIIVLVYQNPGDEKPEPLPFINPKIESTSDELFTWEEGCLSVPGYFEARERPKSVVASFKDLTGEDKSVELDGLYAFAFLHEMDHLNGHLFIDNLSVFKKKFTVEKRIKNFFKKKKK